MVDYSRCAISNCGMSPSRPALTFHDLDLLFRLCSQLRRHLDRGLDDGIELDFSQVQILVHVAQNEGDCRPSTTTGLDEALGLPAGQVKYLVGKLMTAKMLEEDTTSPWRDGRRKQLRISPTGNEVLKLLWPTWDHVVKHALRPIEHADLKQLSDALRALSEAPETLRRSFNASAK